MNPHDFNHMMGGGGQPPMPPPLPPNPHLASGMMPPMPPSHMGMTGMPPMPSHVPMPPMPPMAMGGNMAMPPMPPMPGMMPMMRPQPTTPPLFIGHFSNQFQKADVKLKTRSTIYSVHEICFRSVVKVEGVHIVPLGYTPDAFTIRGRTKPDLKTRPFDLKLYGRNASTKELVPLLLISVSGGVEWMALPAGNGDIEIDYLAVDGDFDDLSIIIHGTVLKSEDESEERKGEILPPYPNVFDEMQLPGDVARKMFADSNVLSTTGDMIEEEWSALLNHSDSEEEKYITLDTICQHAKLENNDSFQQQFREVIGSLSVNHEYSLLPITILADLVEKIFSVESSDCNEIEQYYERAQQLHQVSCALEICWKTSVNGSDNQELGCVKDIIGEDGSITLCENIVAILRYLFDIHDTSSQAKCFRSHTMEDQRNIINLVGKEVLECTRLILVNEFFAKSFVDLEGDHILLSLILQQQQYPLPENLFILTIQCVLELSAFPRLLSKTIFPDLESVGEYDSGEREMAVNQTYQSLLYTMASLKSNSNLAQLSGKIINIWTFIGYLRSVRSSLQNALLGEMKSVAQAIHEIYAMNENIPSSDVMEGHENRIQEEQTKTVAACHQACEHIFTIHQRILAQIYLLKASWVKCKESGVEMLKSVEMCFCDILQEEKLFSTIISLLSIRKLVLELTTMVDWIAHPKSHELHHVASSLSTITQSLLESLFHEKYHVAFFASNISAIEYVWNEFGIDGIEDGQGGFAIRYALHESSEDKVRLLLAKGWSSCYYLQMMMKLQTLLQPFTSEAILSGEQIEMSSTTMMIVTEFMNHISIQTQVCNSTSLYFLQSFASIVQQLAEVTITDKEVFRYNHNLSKAALSILLTILSSFLLCSPQVLNRHELSVFYEIADTGFAGSMSSLAILHSRTSTYLHCEISSVTDAITSLQQISAQAFSSPDHIIKLIKSIQILSNREETISTSSAYQIILISRDVLSYAYHSLHLIYGKFLHSAHSTSSELLMIPDEEISQFESIYSADGLTMAQIIQLHHYILILVMHVLNFLPLNLKVYAKYSSTIDNQDLTVLHQLILRLVALYHHFSNLYLETSMVDVGENIRNSIINSLRMLDSTSMLTGMEISGAVPSKRGPYSLIFYLLNIGIYRNSVPGLLRRLLPDRGLMTYQVLFLDFELYKLNPKFQAIWQHLEREGYTPQISMNLERKLCNSWRQYLEFCEESYYSLWCDQEFSIAITQNDIEDGYKPVSLSENFKQLWLMGSSNVSLASDLCDTVIKLAAFSTSTSLIQVPALLLRSLSVLYLQAIQQPADVKLSLESYLSMLLRAIENLVQGSLSLNYELIKNGILHTLFHLISQSELSISMMGLQVILTCYKRLEQYRVAIKNLPNPVSTQKFSQQASYEVHLQLILNNISVTLVDLLPSLLFKHQESTSFLQQGIFVVYSLPKTIFWNRLVSGLSGVGQGFTMEFIAVKLWIACEESFQYLNELLDVKKQSAMFGAIFDQLPFTEDDLENMVLEAQGQYAVAITSLKSILEMVLWSYETKHISLSIMSKAMRTTLADPKKVIIRFQRMYTMWTISFASQIAEEAKSNGFSERKSLFTSSNLQELYDSRHALISIHLKWLVELTNKYSRYHLLKEEKCLNPIPLPTVDAEKWNSVIQSVDLSKPWKSFETESSFKPFESFCMETITRTQCFQNESHPCSSKSVSCNFNHIELMNVLHQDVRSQYFASWNGIDSQVKIHRVMIREVLQSRITSKSEENQDDHKFEIFHKLKKQRVAKSILPEDDYVEYDEVLFPKPQKEMEVVQSTNGNGILEQNDLTSFLASVDNELANNSNNLEYSTPLQDWNSMDAMKSPESQAPVEETNTRPAPRLQGVPKAKHNSSLGKYFQHSGDSFGTNRRFDGGGADNQNRRQGHENNGQGRNDYRNRESSGRQNFNQHDNSTNGGGNYQDRQRNNGRFSGGRQSQENGGDHQQNSYQNRNNNNQNNYQPQQRYPRGQQQPHFNNNQQHQAPSGTNSFLPAPPRPPNFIPPPPGAPMAGVPPPPLPPQNMPQGFVPPPRPPMFSQLPPPPLPPQFPPYKQ